ncbi:MAG: hypothetical protein A2X34_00645 [Elusimicrobia bacterium GWC2_51_8]|nr:MAG: hypothetical protein A2X33_06410 [Elusimicrobia bacterium GWA2_51_34]OGR64126.1 MAG: hypothetical protein A2X34_00645 [Elusimicrobia bacterium GWC2_51_8]OGR86751.1 MAG: hypothetical protein A2021_09705 [Elusimicrobia bacterium GWF2_52_66]HAF95074.1 hypothetical protein [Elusimicrobiota bacterium]HCE99027.1 hypothetical protein [Elusimicrobiota bacterium]
MTPENEYKKKSADGKNPEKNSNRDILLYLFVLIRQNKKWWLLPFLFVLAFLSIFVSLSGNQAILPAIYALF